MGRGNTALADALVAMMMLGGAVSGDQSASEDKKIIWWQNYVAGTTP